MVSIFHVLINRPVKNDLWNNGNDNRKNLESKKLHATNAPLHLPEMSNFGRSRHLKAGASVGDFNNKDYTFNCT